MRYRSKATYNLLYVWDQVNNLLPRRTSRGESTVVDPVDVHLIYYREPVVDAITSMQLHADVEVFDPFERTSGVDEQMSVLKEATR